MARSAEQIARDLRAEAARLERRAAAFKDAADKLDPGKEKE